jgi:hypothetical protein
MLHATDTNKRASLMSLQQVTNHFFISENFTHSKWSGLQRNAAVPARWSDGSKPFLLSACSAAL